MFHRAIKNAMAVMGLYRLFSAVGIQGVKAGFAILHRKSISFWGQTILNTRGGSGHLGEGSASLGTRKRTLMDLPLLPKKEMGVILTV